MLGGGVDAATLVAALGAGPPPPECQSRTPASIRHIPAPPQRAVKPDLRCDAGLRGLRTPYIRRGSWAAGLRAQYIHIGVSTGISRYI